MVKDGQKGILYGVNSDDVAKLNREQQEFWKTVGEIKKINCEAFCAIGKRNLKITEEKLYIPDSVEYIGKRAFAGQDCVKEIVLPSGLKFIDREAFVGCSQLEYIEIPENVEWIGNNAFYCCMNLEKIVLNSYKGFSAETILGCNKIKDIVFSEKAVMQMANELFGTNVNISVKETTPQDNEKHRKSNKTREK